jgi:hypothetical protein
VLVTAIMVCLLATLASSGPTEEAVPAADDDVVLELWFSSSAAPCSRRRVPEAAAFAV